jgi:hypothetical protein
MIKHLKYLSYVLRHKLYVSIECFKAGLIWRGVVHDVSKFRPSEWTPYVQSFYGGWAYKDRPEWVKKQFDLAWLRHQHRNDHHWQWWMQQSKDGFRLLPMSREALLEMLCDWKGAGRAQGNAGGWDEVASWYKQRRHKIKLHPETRKTVELLIDYMRNK